jgi:hypothetical protein
MVEGEWHNYPEQAAAGLWTTPSDLLRLSAHLLDIHRGETEEDGVISPEMLAQAWTAHRGDEEGFSNYGLGFGVDGQGDAFTFGHGGSNEGFKAQWTVYAERGQGVVVMTNGDRGSALAAEIVRSVSEAYGWPGFKSRVRAVADLAPDELAAYQGAYAMVDNEAFVVSVQPLTRELEVDVPGQGTYTLHPAAETPDEFFDATDGQVIRFVRDDDGAVTALELANGVRFDRVAEAGQG